MGNPRNEFEDDDLARKVSRKSRSEFESPYRFPGRNGGSLDELTVPSLLGHSSLATTQIYTHVEDAQKREAVMGLRRKATAGEVGLGRKKK